MNAKSLSVFNSYHIVLILLCIANVLELFIPRMDEGNYFVRIPIQLVNGGLLMLMWASLLVNKIHWNRVTKAIFLFVPLILLYSYFYVITQKFDVGDYASYIRFLLWTTSLVYFYEMLLRYGIHKKLMYLYILTFVAAVAKKILDTSLFASETLGAGDTAALPLLFIIPLILICFGKKSRFIVLSIVVVLILFSLRRTVILGLVLCLPFILRYLSAQLKFFHFVVLGALFVALSYYSWEYVGDAIYYRFEDLMLGDKGGTKESFGSGRSVFYLTVWNGWLNGGPVSLFLGNGLVSAENLLMKVNNIKHAHNDFLQIAYTFGLLGVGLWLGFLLRLWNFRKQIKQYSPLYMPLFYVCLISYLVIAMASGCALRITTLPFALSVSLLLYQVQLGKAKQLEQEDEIYPYEAQLYVGV